MSQTISLPVPRTVEEASSHQVPWYVWNFALASLSATVGGTWDISWHATIGRDTFWTPAHMAIYLCGVLAGLGSAYLILQTTFADSSLRGASVRMWGFRGPVGAFLGAWGGVAMLVSAPFDNWWHDAYGLDVKILSPPHVVLIFGIVAIKMAALLLALGAMNRAITPNRRAIEWLFLFVGALLARDLIGVFLEFLHRTHMHSARFYLVVCLMAPVGLLGVAHASRRKWGATIVAGVITAMGLALLWILPLFPAEPKLGPVFRDVRHFIPVGGFPMLLLVPAVVIDLVRARTVRWGAWRRAVLCGLVFFGSFIAMQWPFADFLQSPAARNWFFGSHYLAYFVPPTSAAARYVFAQVEPTAAQFWTRMALAALAAIVSTRLGLAWGDGMRRIKR